MGEIGELAKALAFLAAGIGSGIVTIGAGLGIGKIAAAAMDGTARQPEATNAIRMTMIIAAAMIEGAALFGLVVCVLLIVLIK
jgi:F-type H+-transporting ATPase subunit c